MLSHLALSPNWLNTNGIELSDKSHEITKKRIKIFNFKADSLIFDEAENLSKHFSKKNNLDLIYSFGVLHHSSSLQKCLREIYKIMSPKTELKVTRIWIGTMFCVISKIILMSIKL